MKRILFLLLAATLPGWAAAADVGVSIRIGEPGFYGQIDIGDYPRPALIYPQPVVIDVIPVGVVRPPMYLHVPPGHAKKWSKHCREYGACGYPVYFVQDRWYNDVYVPAYRAKHGGPGDGGHGKGKPDKGKGHK
ncbi:hypothetical protein AAG565_10365 [Fontimonas sp. SYSU GA230001]|uniref:hypothetical protein n=1 Tax=Fontimonas sp. SYSU GA230001 TaxID=3142450 RepID=UPI0032B36CD3